MSYDPYGSHLPVLLSCLMATSGPVLELGMGYYSTPVLHAMCYPNRRLVSFESDAEFASGFAAYGSGHHEIHIGWEALDALVDQPWSVVLVDHGDHGDPTRRASDAARFTQADYIVAHDAQFVISSDVGTIGDQFQRLVATKYPWQRLCSHLTPHTLIFGKYEIPVLL